MITPNDPDYQQTKARLKKRTPLEPIFAELAAWVAERFGVKPVDFWYDLHMPDRTPRLEIIVRTDDEDTTLTQGEWRMSAARQAEVAKAFADLVAKHGLQAKYQTQSLFVYPGVFDDVARKDANESVSEKDIAALKRKLKNPELWEIVKQFDTATFFFYTKEQAEKNKTNGLLEKYTAAWGKLAAKHDEFGLFAQRGVTVYFDSKEVFDNDYGGNWYHYFK